MKKNKFIEELIRSISDKEMIASDAIDAIKDFEDFVLHYSYIEKEERKELIDASKTITIQDVEMVDLFVKEYN